MSCKHYGTRYTPPISSCNNIDVYLDINGYTSIAGDAMDNGSSDACGIYEITVNPNTFGCVNVEHSGHGNSDS